MRFSSNKGEREYGALQDLLISGKTVHPMLDGVEVPKAVMVDDEEGIIVACVLDEHGNITTDDEGSVATRTLRGDVSIEIRERR
jgi:hypothetical protein